MFDIVLKMIINGGWVMAPLFMLSIAAWVIILERYYFYRNVDFDKTEQSLPQTPKDIEKFLGDNRAAGHPETIMTEFLQALQSAKANGVGAAQRMLQEKLLFAEHSLNRKLSLLSALAAIAPLLGLLGTVGGMINTFEVITVYGNGNPSLMSAGISEAMLTTQTGLLVALPILLFHNYLTNRAKHILDEARSISNIYLSAVE